MLVYAGIDEAGYGPVVGPLCVASTVFTVEEHDGPAAPNLWRLLNRAVCRKVTDSRRRIAVNDSKLIKGANNAAKHPLLHLERGVLSFHSSLDERSTMPESCNVLLDALHCKPPDMPWYESATPLPVANDAGLLRVGLSRLRRSLNEAGVGLRLMQCRVVDAPEFNRGIRTLGNKAAVNLFAVLRLCEHIRRRFATDHPHIVVDRQGGRMHYRQQLQDTWPAARIAILDEDERVSRYRLDLPEGPMTVTFTTEAEAVHLPVALASMTAKYVRELMMIRFNRYFRQQMPELKPTAGYYQDGRRFLSDIEGLITRLDVPRQDLIRSA